MEKDPNYDDCTFTSTRVDDFLIVGLDTDPIMEALKANDAKHDELNPTSCLALESKTSYVGKVKIHNQKCIKESTSQIESSLGKQSKQENVPAHPECHPELYESRLLSNDKIAEHQKFIGTLQQMKQSLRLDMLRVLSSLASH